MLECHNGCIFLLRITPHPAPKVDINKPKNENNPLMKEAKRSWHNLCQATDVSWQSTTQMVIKQP